MDKLETRNIVDEMQKSFMEYSMSVIVSRALPDLRDGLKPVHRRILYTMYEDGLTPDKAYRKSATTVGDVLGKYHPHGDTAVYDAMVRMAQDFSYRYMLVDGHGNFGSIDGYGAAAYRYTEARLSKISLELLRDINKNTIDFVPNFDGASKEPTVLPSRFPNILVNGTMGIAVGMATNIPPHNLGEVIDGCVAYIDNNDITIPELMQYIKGPDFPTGGTILGNSGIKQAYETGRGTITVRAKAHIEDANGKNQIIITEIPYIVNKIDLKEKIAELVRDKVVEGITDLHDESTLDGVKIILHLKKEANANVVLNQLYKHTQLQTTFGIIMLMLDEGQPKTLDLKSIISKYIDFQKEVVYRRTKYDCDKAEERVHILNGLKIAVDNIDEVVRIIRSSKDDTVAQKTLMEKFGLDDIQSNAILEMKLRRLTGLERDKIIEELNQLLEVIKQLKEILASNAKILEIVKKELLEIKI
jgi:DNA gyrase subunit A